MAEVGLRSVVRSARMYSSSVSIEKRRSRAEITVVPGEHEMMDSFLRGIGGSRLSSHMSAGSVYLLSNAMRERVCRAGKMRRVDASRGTLRPIGLLP